MNINIFEKTKQQENLQSQNSFVDEHTLDLKRKIDARKNKQKKVRIIFVTLIATVIFFAAFTAYSQYQLITLTKDEQGGSVPEGLPKTGEEVVSLLSKHILLPSGNPQIAEIRDASQLQDSQAFFKNAKNGDIVVVYETTIFIYRPSQDIVVATGDISGAGQLKP